MATSQPPVPYRDRPLTAPTRRHPKPSELPSNPKKLPSAARSASDDVDRTLDGVRVLVVEDDPPSLRLLRAVLQGEGYDVRFATSAEEAFALLETFRPAVMIVDLILPLMSGLLFAQQLKSNPVTRDIPLLAVTAFNGHAAERVALDAGFAAYVRKPLDPGDFCELLRRTLKGTAC
jgi:two-component system cell cycle response regulator/two-component system cell cycle response regulator DivK